MTTRLVVTGNDDDGRSIVFSDDAAPRVPGRDGIAITGLWLLDPEQSPDAPCEGDTDYVTLQPPPGAASWRVYELPPDDVVHEHMAARDLPESERVAFHTTDTLDYVIVLDGAVTLLLDKESVELETGDCVVQRGTRHAWSNRSGRPVHLMSVMISTR